MWSWLLLAPSKLARMLMKIAARMAQPRGLPVTAPKVLNLEPEGPKPQTRQAVKASTLNQ